MLKYTAKRTAVTVALSTALLGGPTCPAYAMTGPLADTVADILAVVVLIIVPIAAIYLFWKVHVLPEVIAEKRHHPQKEAIKVLCLLSLVFGGLLWPIAWLWAYTKPTLHKLAYGTDKHEDYFAEAEAEARQAKEEVAQLHDDIEQLDSAEHTTAAQLAEIRDKLTQLETRLTRTDGKETG